MAASKILQPLVYTLCTLISLGCAASPKGLSDTISSGSTPSPVAITARCSNPDIASLATLLGLMPPWDEEHNETRLQLANLMARQAEQGCLEEAWELFAETARAFPYTAIGIKALHGSCVLGLRLQLEPQKMDTLLTVYPNRDAALLEVVRNSPRAEAQAILGAYGGTRAEELLNKYEKYRSSTTP